MFFTEIFTRSIVVSFWPLHQLLSCNIGGCENSNVFFISYQETDTTVDALSGVIKELNDRNADSSLLFRPQCLQI